ncbi:MAG: 3-oxo-tetronate kinase [Betaproteobacteria bacterium]
MKLGCIADDFTGATDLANCLVRVGMRVLLSIGVPTQALEQSVDAVVVALKSRTVAAQQAVQQSLQACESLRARGAQQIYFKYCSTFDSTPQGNIGPVIEALMAALGTDFTVATPAFAANQRTVFQGHLFVGDTLLSESGMQLHPLTPMTDSNLVRLLQVQCQRKVGLIAHARVAAGVASISARMRELRAQGVGVAIADAVCDDDLMRLGTAFRDLPLVTGASGLAMGLAQNFGFSANDHASDLPPPRGYQAIVSGSCSRATLQQVQHFVRCGHAAYAVDPLQWLRDAQCGRDPVADVLGWAEPLLASGPVLVYASAQPNAVSAVQAQLGAEQAGILVERALGAVARGLVQRGVRQLVLAGGETSGECVRALGISQLQIGPQIAPGVPWCYARLTGDDGLHLALKSGNFGSDDFFALAFERLLGACP